MNCPNCSRGTIRYLGTDVNHVAWYTCTCCRSKFADYDEQPCTNCDTYNLVDSVISTVCLSCGHTEEIKHAV